MEGEARGPTRGNERSENQADRDREQAATRKAASLKDDGRTTVFSGANTSMETPPHSLMAEGDWAPAAAGLNLGPRRRWPGPAPRGGQGKGKAAC